MDRTERIKKAYCDTSRFTLKDPAYFSWVYFLLEEEMKRDSEREDLTTRLVLNGNKQTKIGRIITKEAGIISGVWEVENFLKTLKLKQKWYVKDGKSVKNGDIILEIQGDAYAILQAERVILNFLGRLSGIASETVKYVQKVPSHVFIVPTRKTLWGLLDKRACIDGGGGTHRLNASSAVLIKENHWALLKNRNIAQLREVFKNTPKELFGKFVEIEVENKEEAFDACKILSDLKERNIQGILMFDNFTTKQIEEILPILKQNFSNILFEASGGINLDNIFEYGKTGIDVISVGAITHSVKSLDLSFKII